MSHPNQAWSYSLRDWTIDERALEAEAAPPECPRCGRTGFYGPRTLKGQKYRACRFCGLWQDVDEKLRYHLPSVHGCANWPSVAGAPYIWWVAPGETSYTCPYCMSDVDAKSTEVHNPFLHQDHPWWKVPQKKSHSRYLKFWSRWPMTNGRTYL